MVAPGQTIGRFTIGERLGAGGSATVWAAKDASGLEVALKVLHGNLVGRSATHGPAPTTRFLAEGSLLMRLNHPGMVRVVEIIDQPEDRLIAFAMERLHGNNLLELSKGEIIEMPDLLEALASISKTLGHLHDHGIVHRDVKQSNIFVCSERTSPNEAMIKLLDFGIAKQLDEAFEMESTHQGHVVGTTHTLTPEVISRAEGKQVALTGAVDQWGIGVALYKTLTGRFPFRSEDYAALLAQIRTSSPPSMVLKERFGYTSVPGPIDTIIQRTLAKNPAERYPTAHALADALLDARDLLCDDAPPVDNVTMEMSWAGPTGPVNLDDLPAQAIRITKEFDLGSNPVISSTVMSQAQTVDQNRTIQEEGYRDPSNVDYTGDERTSLDQRALSHATIDAAAGDPTRLNQPVLDPVEVIDYSTNYDRTTLDRPALTRAMSERSQIATALDQTPPGELADGPIETTSNGVQDPIEYSGDESTMLDPQGLNAAIIRAAVAKDQAEREESTRGSIDPIEYTGDESTVLGQRALEYSTINSDGPGPIEYSGEERTSLDQMAIDPSVVEQPYFEARPSANQTEPNQAVKWPRDPASVDQPFPEDERGPRRVTTAPLDPPVPTIEAPEPTPEYQPEPTPQYKPPPQVPPEEVADTRLVPQAELRAALSQVSASTIEPQPTNTAPVPDTAPLPAPPPQGGGGLPWPIKLAIGGTVLFVGFLIGWFFLIPS